ncbi:MAG: porin family protein [Holophagaceae bacterium]|nr:porin family protein [Holophagaceae bacterium]
MRNKSISSFVGLLLIGMGIQASAQQQQKGWQVGVSVPTALEGTKEWTNSTVGYNVEGAYLMPLSGGFATLRAGMGVNHFPGKEMKRLSPHPDAEPTDFFNTTIGLTGIQASADVLFPVGSSKLSLFVGLSLNTWIKDVKGQDPYFPNGLEPWEPNNNPNEFDYALSGTVKNAFGKYGLRVGAEYALNDKLSFALTFQVTELGTDSEFYKNKWASVGDWEWDWDAWQWNWLDPAIDPDGFDIYGKHNVNPSWIQFGIRYKF